MDKLLLNVSEVCEILRVKPSWVYRATSDGILSHIKLRNGLRFHKADVMNLVKNGTQADVESVMALKVRCGDVK